MYTDDKSSKALFSTFVDKSFTKATLIHVCEKKGVKASGLKSVVISECLRLYTPTQLMVRLEVAKTLPWYEKLIIGCLLQGQKSAREILNTELTEVILGKDLPEAVFKGLDAFQPKRPLSIYESKAYLRQQIYKLKTKGTILLNRGSRTYYINPALQDYFNQMFGSMSVDELLQDIEDDVSGIIANINERFRAPPANEPSQFLIKDIGEGTWLPGPLNAWVSKTDIAQFLRCKYRVFVVHNRNLSFDEVRDPKLVRSLLEKGSQFERSLISHLPFEEVASLESVIDKNVIFRTPELIQNHELGIRGIVDLIQIEKGKLYPIEIKYHRDVSEVDRLELAFYWGLLEPLRRGKPSPKGYTLLNTGEVVEVTLTNEDFVNLDNLISEIRYVKQLGTEPALSKECNYCRLLEECFPRVREKGGLTLIHGIAGIRQEELNSLGIKDIHALAAADTEELHRAWRQLTPHAPGLTEIREMQIHIRSLEEERPIYFGSSGVPIGNEVLVLDLEYENFMCIWLVGLLASDTEAAQCCQLFADEVQEEKEILVKSAALLKKYPTYQILTWDGLRADIPRLEAAWGRHGLPPQELEDLKRRHLDLYNFFLRNCRFPLVSFGLKEVGRYLGFKRMHEDMDGLEAQMLYRQYLNMPKNNKRQRPNIKQRLLEYNKEDLEATLFVLSQLRSLASNTVLTS